MQVLINLVLGGSNRAANVHSTKFNTRLSKAALSRSLMFDLTYGYASTSASSFELLVGEGVCTTENVNLTSNFSLMPAADLAPEAVIHLR